MKLLVLACCVCLVYCQDAVTPGEEEPLIRCTRPLCDVVCPHGYVKDEYGCDTCMCELDPIDDVMCPEPMCADDCSAFGGYKKNAEGCLTCECKELATCDDIECSINQRCRGDLSHCNSEMGEVECLPRPICEDIDDHLPIPEGCPNRKCVDHMCEYGLSRDSSGCPTCDCASDPCEEHQCHGSQICEVELAEGCEGVTCPHVATCRVRSLCHHHQQFQDDAASGAPVPDWFPVMGDPLDYRPECLDDGSFHPTQCKMEELRCWCVDDRGIEIPGTATFLLGDQQPPQCESNTAESMDIQFQVFHELPNIQDYLDDFENTAKDYLSHWLTVDEEHIVIAKIEMPEDLTVAIHARVTADDETDLASAAFHMHDEMSRHHCNIRFQRQNMRTDPHSMNVQPYYSYPEGDGLEEEDDPPNDVSSYCRAHPKAVIVGCVGGSILLLLLAVVIFSMCKTKRKASHQFKHKKFENYEKNLGLAGEMMNAHPDLQAEEKEPAVAIISVTDTDGATVA